MTDADVEAVAKACEYAAEYEDMGYYDDERYRVISNWDDIARAAIAVIEARKNG